MKLLGKPQHRTNFLFYTLLAIFSGTPGSTWAQRSSSPVLHQALVFRNAIPARAKSTSSLETVDLAEFPLNTVISDQYKSIGILFSGGNGGPFIADDGASATNPVLSGSPEFEGSITATFVSPKDPSKPANAYDVSFVAGYFDDFNSTLVTWYDTNGNEIGSATNSTLGFQTFYFPGPIGGFSIQIIGEEQYGYEIQDISFAHESNLSDVADPSKAFGDPDDNPGSADAGDPVDVATGNVYRKTTDYQSAGQNTISFDRYYNSMPSTINLPTYAKSLGATWRSTFDRYLSITMSGTGGSVLAERPDGQFLTFTLSRSRTWFSESDVSSVLAQAGSAWTLTTADDTTETYRELGSGEALLTSIKARDGYTQTLSYNSANQLLMVADTNSRNLQFNYFANGLLNTVTLPDQSKLAYSYSSSGVSGTNQDQLTSVTYPTAPATSWNYAYENSTFPFALTGETDELGNIFTSWIYDDQSRCVSVAQANQANYTQFSYNLDGTTTVTTPLGEQDTYKFKTLQGVPKIVEIDRAADGTVVAASEFLTYDVNGYIESVKDWNGAITAYTHDKRGDELTHTLAKDTRFAETTRTNWHRDFHLPLEIVTPLEAILFTYDNNGNMLRRIEIADGQRRIFDYTYNSQGQVLTATDPNKNNTVYSYDNQNNLDAVTDSLNHATLTTSFNANGWPLSIQDPNALLTTFTYDVRGNLKTRTVGMEKTSFTYDVANNLVQVTLPDNSFLLYAYDNAHRLTGITDALGNATVYTLDNNGNRIETDVYDPQNALVETSGQSFDGLSRLYQNLGALPGEITTYGYDSNGNQTSTLDPLFNTTNNLYDVLDRLSESIDAKNGVIKYGYDRENRLTNVIDPRTLRTSYAYSGPNNQTSLHSPDTGATARRFDSAGNIIETTDALGRVSYGFDSLERLKTKTLPRNKTIAFGYDRGTYGIGRLTSMTDLSGSTSWQYDQHGHLLEKAQTIGTVELTTQTSYDSFGRVKAVVYPSGHVITNLYDPVSGQVTGIQVDGKTLVTSGSYFAFGPVASWADGNGDHYQRSYDEDGRVYDIAVTGVPGDLEQSFSYDVANLITSETDSLLSAPNSFAYDELNRLTGVAGGFTESFSYDPTGNRQSLTTSTSNVIYAYAKTNNWLTSDAPKQKYKYNGLGELISDGAHTFTYDALGEMTGLLSDKATKVQYVYDGLGERVEKFGTAVGGSAIYFTYDQDGKLLGEYDQKGHAIEETVYLANMPVGVVESGSLCYINPDQLGAPHTITNQSGVVVWQWATEPFGNNSPAAVAGFTYNIRFPGQYADSETGLYYNHARSYNSGMGRYVESDPIGLIGGINTFAYVGNNPFSRNDFFGLYWQYSQSSGDLTYVNNDTGAQAPIGTGYSGHGVGRNNPEMEDVPDVGPIPQGTWQIGHMYDNSGSTGPGTMNLTPIGGGALSSERDLFRIHGDNTIGDASTGCIILGPGIRNRISNSGDNILQVVP
jgi:RHS repeat-associated protein